MIRSVVICNTSGKPRLIKFYDDTTEVEQQEFFRETYSLLNKRRSGSCNFLESPSNDGSFRIIYRQYSTIYIVFCVDFAESELGILDLIQVFVDLLDRTFENVCELDIIFNSDKVHYLLNEIICGGIVLETNHSEILIRFHEQESIAKSSTDSSADVGPRVSSSSYLSEKILSGVRAGSSFIASVVPSSASLTKSWVSNTASSTPFRISHRSGSHSISGDATNQKPSESEKLCF